MSTYNEIFTRSFSRREQKKLRYGASIGCFLIALCFCTIIHPYLTPFPVGYLRIANGNGPKMLVTSEETSKHLQSYVEMNREAKQIRYISNVRSDICEMDGDVRVQGSSATVFVASSVMENRSWTIRPYARKEDETAMSRVRKFTVNAVHSESMPECTKTHNIPAIIFSIGGYSGNNFHDFTDTIIPLFTTSRQFNGEVQFLLANKHSMWTSKFVTILGKLSRYQTIDIDKEGGVHCFPKMIIGLKRDQKELNIDPSLSTYSIKDFRSFLRSSYSLQREIAINLRTMEAKRPCLLIVSRRKTRAIMNVRQIAQVAQSLGYDVMVTETSANLSHVSKLVNSCDVMLGVHGAGLTNLVFLPENAVLIQVVPWGEMGWLARTFFAEPAKSMGLKYLEYKINIGESSLIKQYPLDHQVFRDPFSISKKGWSAFKSVYLDKQDVRLDVGRLRETLLEALQLLHV